MTFDLELLRQREFPWAAAGESIYLNTGSTGPLPTRTVEAVARFTHLRAAPHRMTHEMQFGTLARSRELIARLIGASGKEIALATNTSFGINVAATSLPLGAGDVVLGIEGEFPANVYPWMASAESRGFEFRLLPLVDSLPSEDQLLAALDDPGVRAVALSWVGFASGYRFDLKKIGAECRRRDITFIVDASQGLGPLTLDVEACAIDILACGAQKWLLSPWGTGFLFVRRSLLDRLDPVFVSWMGVAGSDDFSQLVEYDMTWRDDARRFEFITLPFQEFAGLNTSLELFFELGTTTVAERTADLVNRVFRWADANNVGMLTPGEAARRGGIASLRLGDAAKRSERLTRAGVSHSLREGCIRLSPYFFNTTDEVDAALQLLVD